MRLATVPQLHINEFAGAGITELESGITNGVGEKRGEINYLTQRPSIDVFADASDNSAAARGRAIYWWDADSTLYILNDGTIWTGNYSASFSTSPTAGTKKCKFFEVGVYLVLLDPENDEGWTITTAGVTAAISDGDFPPNLGTAVPLAHGGAVLDDYLFVLGTNGIIYSSNNGDPTAWTALDFIEAEREPDGGVYLGKHHDNLVAYGFSTIEFFYDAANAVGSPLNRRQDVSYNIGCSSGESVWDEGDRSFFIGVNYSGAFSVYLLENFQIGIVSDSTLDSFLTQAIQRDGYSAVGSGFSAQGHTYYLITLYSTPTDVSPAITLCFDAKTGLWSQWETTINGISNLPLVGWTKRTGASERFGEGVLANGDLISINDNLSPTDSILGSTYVADGYVAVNYVTKTTTEGTPITMKARLGMFDGGTNGYKYPDNYRHVADRTEDSQTLILRWANENSASWNPDRTLDTSVYTKVHQAGRFQRRNHELEYSGTEQIEIEAIEFDVEIGPR